MDCSISFEKVGCKTPSIANKINCLCVLGVLNNQQGIAIKQEMLEWLSQQFNVVVCLQDTPGDMFEFPAIKTATELSIRYNNNALYIHSKGAGNKIPGNFKTAMMAPGIKYPQSATPEDCQRIVRLMWKKEFTYPRLNNYLDVLNTSVPTVVCPFTGPERITWQNGWLMNPTAASILSKSLHLSSDRYYYEQVFMHLSDIVVKGMILNDFSLTEQHHKRLWDAIWSYSDEAEIRKMV